MHCFWIREIVFSFLWTHRIYFLPLFDFRRFFCESFQLGFIFSIIDLRIDKSETIVRKNTGHDYLIDYILAEDSLFTDSENLCKFFYRSQFSSCFLQELRYLYKNVLAIRTVPGREWYQGTRYQIERFKDSVARIVMQIMYFILLLALPESLLTIWNCIPLRC